MGYTHYFTNTEDLPPLSLGAMSHLKTIFLIYGSLVQFEEDDNRAPVVEPSTIRFNGIGSDAHETFLWKLEKGFNFCKTARKEYDIVVCLVLLCLKNEYGDKFHLSSDGNANDWKRAFDEFEHLTSVKIDSNVL